ncbi:Chloroplast protein import component [Parasponia andersonii]|uniref:Chloroplast protein import component n=1 Tax=Parasponia andersonii TaxID=3476 RepID=A0A2P5DYX8_PARAD|nr:Chloroplast protein import component [Parasponia andersonii]
MDPNKLSSPEAAAATTASTPPSSLSSGSSYSFSPYQYSDVDASPETYVSSIDNGDNSVVSDGGGSGNGGGFVSGVKEFEFEPALGKPPIHGGDSFEKNPDQVVGGEEKSALFVGSSEFSMPSGERPIAKVSIDDGGENDDDYNDYGIGGSRVGILGVQELGKESAIVGAESSLEGLGTGGGGDFKQDEVLAETGLIENSNFGDVVKENGLRNDQGGDRVFEGSKLDDGIGEERLVEQKNEDFDGREWGLGASEEVEDGKIVDGGNDKDNSVILEEKDKKLVEGDGTSFGGDDSVVEVVQVNVSASGAAIVGVTEELDDSGIRGIEVPEGVKLDNGFENLRCSTEEFIGAKSIALDSESEGNAVAGSVISGPDEVDSRKIQGSEDGGLEADSEVQQNSLLIEKGADIAEVRPDDELVGRNEAESLAQHELVHVAIPSDNAESSIEEPTSSRVSREILVEEEDDDDKQLPEEYDEVDGSGTDEETEGIVFGSSAKQFLEELERASGAGSHSGADSSRDHSQRIDGQIVTDSDEEVETDEEGGGKELFDSAALASLLKAATGSTSDGGNITITTSDGSRLFSVERPAGLGSSLPSVKPAPRPHHSNLFNPSNLAVGGDSENNLSEEEKKRLEKFQQLRVKYLRLVNRVGGSTEDSIARQVLYRLALVSGRQTGPTFSLENAKATALQLEAEGKDDLNFSLNILVLGKTGVGKSATINSIFGEEKTPIYAFGPSTTTVKEIVGTVDGVKIRVFDTPGLKSAAMEQSSNRKILSSVKRFTKKCPPDIVLYVDRLDTQSRDLNDLPLLRSITSALGPSIWRSAIVTLTHAASSPPDGPTGTPLNYELFVAQRSQIVQQSIGQAVGDLRIMSPSLMNPISLVENHPSCRKNRDGQKVLPNGQAWRSQLLLLSYSMKILSEASNLSKPQESFDHRKLFGFRARSPPLPYLLSWLLQSRTHPKLSADQGGENGDSDIDLDDLSDSDGEEEDEYDQLPPFKPLRNSQIAKLSREQRKAYLEEYDYRVKLLQKKQWREELKRMKDMKKRGGKFSAEEYAFAGEDDPENGTPAAVPVALPDMALPPSFDGDNPAYRYRFLEPTSQFLARPVLDTHGWDHDCGYDGVNLEHNLAILSRFPAAVSVQITKDKKEFNIHLDSSVATKHGENGSSMAGFDIQNIGKQLAYIVRGETKFKSFRKNKTTAGASVTFLGENVSTGFKIEDQIGLGKRVVLVGSTGIVKSQSDSAYGANLEVRLREADFPIGQDQSSLGLSLVKWRGDLALGANLQSQFSLGRNYKMAVRAGLNNKLSGQISVRTSSSEQLQIAFVAILPIIRSICKLIWPGAAAENYSLY